MRFGLCRHFSQELDIDIVKDPAFKKANDVLTAVTVQLKREGLGKVDYTPSLEPDELKHIYNSTGMNVNTPVGLLNKVWLDIMLHLCPRGREHLRKMNKSTFLIGTNAKGLEYFCHKQDELDKNHRQDDMHNSTLEGRMYAIPGNPLCPVSSFKKYLSKLHPSKNDLWQKPRDSFEEDSFWYCNAALGKNTLANMMSEICRIAKLPRTYNNHSIRATSITLLDAKFASCDIMKVSGHKSETSIKNYSTKTSEKKLEKMSNFLHTSVAIETVESTTEQLQIGNNSVDMVDESTVQDTLYLNQEQINELLIPMPAEIDLNNKQNKSGSVIQNKSDAVIIQNNQTPLQVVSNSNQQNNMMMPQFQDIINSSFTRT